MQIAQVAARPAAERRERRVEEERDQEQEADAEDHRQRQETILDEAPPGALLRIGFDVPDEVQRVLQLDEHRRRADDQCQDADRERELAGLGLAGVLDHRLDHLGAGSSHESAHFTDDAPLHGLAPEDQPAQRDRDQHERSDGEQRVVRERGRELERMVLAELAQRLQQQRSVSMRAHAITWPSVDSAEDVPRLVPAARWRNGPRLW